MDATVASKIRQAMYDADRWVCRIVYRDASGQRTRRLVSPIRMTGRHRRLMALCLSRSEPRQFAWDRIESAELVEAHTVLMGAEEIELLDTSCE